MHRLGVRTIRLIFLVQRVNRRIIPKYLYNYCSINMYLEFTTLCLFFYCGVIHITIYILNINFTLFHCFINQSTEDIDYHSDCIPSKTLTQLTNDMAKLKAKGVVDAIPKNKLTLLINFAMRNVDVAANLSAGPVSICHTFIHT